MYILPGVDGLPNPGGGNQAGLENPDDGQGENCQRAEEVAGTIGFLACSAV